MREDLIGYLFGALDAERHDEVHHTLSNSPTLRQELRLLQRAVEPLRWDSEEYSAPAGLAERTCLNVAEQIESNKVTLRPPSPSEVVAGSSRYAWTFSDMIVAAGVCLAAALLFFPAVSQSRYLAQLNNCQNNFRMLGMAHTAYSNANPRGFFPFIPAKGNLNSAGSYAPMLMDKGLVQKKSWFICPSSQLAQDKNWDVPTIQQLKKVKEKKLFLLRRNLGGSYGYVLGYIVDGKLMGIKNKGRSKYALQADAPQIGQDGRRVSSNHGGRGFNVLFEDGHVRFVLLTGRTQKKNILEDDFLVNDRGHVSAGCHEDDSVIGDSTASPLPESYSGIQIEDL